MPTSLLWGKTKEEKKEFDVAQGWIRGEEWGWIGLPTPQSIDTSAWTRIDLYPEMTALTSSPSSSHSEVTIPSESASSPASPPFPPDGGALDNEHDNATEGQVKLETYKMDDGSRSTNRSLSAGLAGVQGELAVPETPPSRGRQSKIPLPLPINVTASESEDKGAFPAYIKPKVDREDQVQFPCLYDLESLKMDVAVTGDVEVGRI